MEDRTIYSDHLMHYGVKRRSGRYPWGSGENPYQHGEDFRARYLELSNSGMSNSKIADYFNDQLGLEGDERMSSKDIQAYVGIANNERKIYLYSQIDSMTEDGFNDSEIGRKLGLNESTVRSLKNEKSRKKTYEATNAANFIKEQIEKKGVVDIGKGTERNLNISKSRMHQVKLMLAAEGYPIYGVGQPYLTNNNGQITMEIACPKGMTEYEAYQARDKGEINTLMDYWSPDGGNTFKERKDIIQYPKSLNSDRLMVRYSDSKPSGLDKDGVIELRRGPEDLSLNGKAYAQVRILVDDTHYLKGMAIYSDDMPPGVDVIFNTNKPSGTELKGPTSDTSVLKPVFDENGNYKSGDPNNPFGTYIKLDGGQSTYIDKNGKEQLSLINKVYEEGDWDTWSRQLPSQFLSKQPKQLIQKQLNQSYADMNLEFEEIKSIPNPTVRKKLLNEFADNCDASAVHLKAAGLPGQSAKVILPVSTLSDREIYAPTYANGQKVALIRYPHQGTFEIPILTVNNNHPGGKKVIGPNSEDCVGINPRTAEILSGADFDGDTVTVIPISSKVRIESKASERNRPRSPFHELEGFNPKVEYPARPGMKVMTNTDMEMGKISNLITDMTLQGAPDSDIVKATKHAQVVIDAEKHKLDYKKSEIDNDIATLKDRYQAHINENGNVSYGASTLISRTSRDVYLPYKRRGNPNINPETGEKSWQAMEYTDPKTGQKKTLPDKTYVDQYPERKKDANGNWYETGRIVTRTTKTKEMANVKDAYELSSGHPVENLYADYANKLKAMANEARKQAIATPRLTYNKAAAEKYSTEVESLMNKLDIAEKNAPLERRAQNLAGGRWNQLVKDNPELKSKDKREKAGKLKNQQLVRARIEVGSNAKGVRINPTEKEWEAIEAGAIHDSKLQEILKKSDPDRIRELATPKTKTTLTPAKLAKLKSMRASGYTLEEIAQGMGVSTSTLNRWLRENA